MKRKLTFKEKLLIFIKRTKYNNLKYTAIVLPFIIISLAAAAWMDRTEKVISVKPKQDQQLTMTMVGDMMFGRHIEEVTERHGHDYLFRHVKTYFDNSDYVSGNFEHPVLEEDPSKYKEAEREIHLHTDSKSVQAVKNAGFTVVNLANNHMMDYGERGLQETIDVFNKEDVEYVGAGKNLKEAKEQISYQNVNGVRVATLGFTDEVLSGSVATGKQGGIVNANPDKLFELIEKARNSKEGNADLVVVNVHWGQEYDTDASPRQKALGKAMVDAGADMIIGHHPHVLQSFEVYKEGVIFYSLGNFIFDQGWTRTKDSALVQYNLDKEGKATIDLVPLQIKEGTPKTATGTLEKNRIYSQLTKETSENVLWSEKEDKLEIVINHKRVLDNMKEREETEKEQAESKS